MGPEFWETAYISEVNRARKVKSDALAAANKNSNPVQKVSVRVFGEDGAPNSNFSKLPELSETSRAKKLIFGLQVNTDKANSHRYHVARYMVHRGPRPHH